MVDNYETVINGGRRFTFMVEDLFTIKTGGVAAVGYVDGMLKEGDKFYIYHPALPVVMATVDGIESSPGKLTDEVENQRAALIIRDIERSQIQPFTVFSSIKPSQMSDGHMTLENPEIVGLIHGFGRYNTVSEYFNLLIYRIIHGRYLMVSYGDDEKKIEFPSITFENGKTIRPLFTDRVALKKAKDAFEGHRTELLVVTFKEAVSMVGGDEDGILINPYSKVPLFLSKEMIEKIVGMDSYKKEFVKPQQNSVKAYELKRDKEIKLMPLDKEEGQLINEAIKTFGKAHAEVSQIGIYRRGDIVNKQYLCILEVDERYVPEIFSNLHRFISPFLGTMDKVEYMVKNESVKGVMEHFGTSYNKQ